MDIIVCVKRVPDVAEAELEIDETQKDIRKEGLAFDINEWDNYAVEEALLIKENYGGNVTVITVGPESSNEVLRKCLAKGADEAIRIDDGGLKGYDSYAVARMLYLAIRDLDYDLILTGAMSGDLAYSVTGPALAQMLGIPYATLVKKVELQNGRLLVNREVEGGVEEVLELELPALLTIQTGINEPRYVSIMGIRRAAKKQIQVKTLEDLGLDREKALEESWVRIEKMYIPVIKAETEFISGSPEDVASKIVGILRERGLV